MKHILVILAVFSVFTFTAPTTAKADHNSRIVSYTACGRPVYAVYQICGYDRCGHPIGHWVTQSSHCGCSVCNPRPICNPSYGHSHGWSGYRPSSGSSFSFGSSRGNCNASRGGFYFSFGR